MNKLITIFLFTLISQTAYSQKDKLYLEYKETYLESAQETLRKSNLPDEKKKMILAQMGKEHTPTNYFSLELENCESIYAFVREGEDEKYVGIPNGAKTVITHVSSIYLSDMCSGDLNSSIGSRTSNIFVRSRREEIKWEIQTDTDLILGIQCVRAISYHCGKELIAYFAPELPYPLGPRWYGGLPGVILKLEIPNTKELIIATAIFKEPILKNKKVEEIFSHSFCNSPQEFRNAKWITSDEYCESKNKKYKTKQNK